jgi:hypothetical protein
MSLPAHRSLEELVHEMHDITGSESTDRPGANRCALHFMTALSRFRESTPQGTPHNLDRQASEK